MKSTPIFNYAIGSCVSERNCTIYYGISASHRMASNGRKKGRFHIIIREKLILGSLKI